MPDQPTPFYPTPKQSRLIWNGKDKHKAVEPLPVQTVEIIRPFYADKAQGALDMAHKTEKVTTPVHKLAGFYRIARKVCCPIPTGVVPVYSLLSYNSAVLVLGFSFARGVD